MRTSFCRLCPNSCGILVAVEDGEVTRVVGDPENPLFAGYTCVKGRAQPDLLRHRDRLRGSLRRQPDGSFTPVRVSDAMDEIADRLGRVIDQHGPRAVATYWGTNVLLSTALMPVSSAFMDAIGSPMRFTAGTIDKPGRMIALALHGAWMAPRQAFDEPEVALLIGVNPLITYQGMPIGNPGKWLSDAVGRGMKLVVIDPRRSDVARRAHLHLQPRPGHDAAILAAMIAVILGDGLDDAEFLAEHAQGLDVLRSTVAPFTPAAVARRADVDADDLIAAARMFGSAKRGYATAGTGPNMSGSGTLVEYLVLALETVCGHWLRAGERVRSPGTVLGGFPAMAQPAPRRPAYGFGEALRVRGLMDTAAGLQTAALADEILLDGPGQVRALISVSGNPLTAWPDQARTAAALEKLDLLVQVDPWMSQTARMADFVIAPTMPLEVPGLTQFLDIQSLFAPTYGLADAYAQYSEAVADPPPGSELIEEWELFYGLAQRMGLPLVLASQAGIVHAEPAALDMACRPDPVELLRLLTRGARVPFEEVACHPHGALFPDPPVHVDPPDPSIAPGARLDIGHPEMMEDLAAMMSTEDPIDPELPFRLVCRRMTHVFNSNPSVPRADRGRRYNPAFLSPTDMAALDVDEGGVIEIRSATAAVLAIAHADENLRAGLVSISHGFGDINQDVSTAREAGTSVARLLSVSAVYDRYSGQPLMTNVPVAVRPLAPALP